MTDNRLTKEEAKYTPQAAKHNERCELCEHFNPPRSCTKVHGIIVSGGWCKLFEREAKRK